MTVLNELDRYHLVESALARLPRRGEPELQLIAAMQEKLAAHSRYIRQVGEDMPEIRGWRWRVRDPAAATTR
jgi:xylulose-5-phosphate/fructose-6-phosphate phosphoketolase